MEERSIFFSGPNSQALALQQKIGGGRLSSVRLQYITPADVSVPAFRKTKQNQHPHRPLLIEEALPPKKVVDDSSFKTLDGFLLLEKSNMSFPDDSRQAVLSKMRLKNIVKEDLTFFTGLMSLDVSENFLEIAPFGVLPKLKQLNICCNNITDISNLSGFDRLQTLDISYNRLNHASVQALENLPSLTELDLSGNNLRSLPVEMYRLFNVEKLMLENNKIAENDVFPILCSMPRLRELSLAYNFLSKISPECCSEGFFPLLEDLDLAFNYFGEEAGLLPLLDLPRLKRIILYGNPVLGPTGEDPLKIYIEDLVSVASSAREGSHMFPVELITEVPKKRRPLKKGETLGRQTLYRDFDVTLVDEKILVDGKRNSDWREEGQQTLFREAMTLAREKVAADSFTENYASNTFLTAPMKPVDRGESERTAEHIVNNVMGRVAQSIGLDNTAEILSLQDQVNIRHTNQRSVLSPSSVSSDTSAKLPAVKNTVDDKVPSALFTRTLSASQALGTHPIAMNTALQALRFALRNPTTDYSEAPTTGSSVPHNYVRSTKASTIRQLPRVQQSIDPVLYERRSQKLKDQNKYSRGLPEPSDAKSARKKARDKTLVQIEEALDSLNANTKQLVSPQGRAGNLQSMREFARPTTGISSLVQMVNEVVQELHV